MRNAEITVNDDLNLACGRRPLLFEWTQFVMRTLTPWAFPTLLTSSVLGATLPAVGQTTIVPSYNEITAISWGYDQSGTLYYLTKFTQPGESRPTPPPPHIVIGTHDVTRFVLNSYTPLTQTVSVIDTLDLGFIEGHSPETGSINRTRSGFFLRVPSMSSMLVFVFPSGGQPKEVARYDVPCLAMRHQGYWYVDGMESLIRLKTEARPDGVQVERWMIGMDGQFIQEDWFAIADSVVAGQLHRSSDITVPLRDGSILQALLDYRPANLPAEEHRRAKGVVSWVIDAVNCVVRDYSVTPFASVEATHAHLRINLPNSQAIHQSSGDVLISIVEFPHLADVMSWDGTADVHVTRFDGFGRPVLMGFGESGRGTAVVDTTYFIREVFRTDTQEHDLWIYRVDGHGNLTGRSIHADAWQ